MKDALQIIGTVILVLAVVFGFMFGFVSLINWNKRRAEEGCSKVAQLSGVKEHKTDGEYNCILVKDGKLETVKD